MRFLVLGPLEIEYAGGRDRLGPKLQHLACVLIAHAGAEVSTNTLIEELWEPGDRDGHVQTLRSHISHLRKRFARLDPDMGDVLVAGVNGGYVLRLSSSQTDAGEFLALAASGRFALDEGRVEEASRLLHDSLDLWREPEVFGVFSTYDFARDYAAELRARRHEARVACAEADLALGRHAEALTELSTLSALAPLDPRLVELHVLAAYRCDGPERAAAICREGTRRLIDRGLDTTALDILHSEVLKRSPRLDWKPTVQVFEIPTPTRTFTGRTPLLDTIAEHLASGADRLSAVALHGLGGVGKSRAAVEFARQYRDRYDVVLWVPANQPTDALARLAQLAHRLGATTAGQGLPEEVAALWEFLRTHGLRWLLIYDDAASVDEIETLWPRADHGHVIITSRNRAWGTLARLIHVGMFSPKESVDFIEGRLGEPVPRAAELAEQLGHLPLALVQACAFVQAAPLPVPDYLDLLAQQPEQLLAVSADDAATAATVATTWNLSLERVSTLDPAAEQLLTLCAFLSPLGMPLGTLTEHRTLLPSPLAEAVADRVRFGLVTSAIGRFSMATVAADSRSIGVHTLVQTVIRAGLGEKSWQRWASLAIRLLDAAFPEDPGPEQIRNLLGNALAAARNAPERGEDARATASVLVKAARAIDRSGDIRHGISPLTQALAIEESLNPVDGTRVARILGMLAYLHRNLADLAVARDYAEHAVDSSRRLCGAQSAASADALAQLGIILFDLDELQGAKDTMAAALEIYAMVRDAEPLDVATAHVIMGLVLWSLFELPSAEAELRTSLELRRGHLGPQHPSVAASLDNLAKVVFDRGNLAEALELNELALAIREEQHGPDHFVVGVSLNHIGFVQRELGATEAALDAHHRALRIFENQFGLDHPHVARTLGGIGAAHIQNREPAEARPVLERAVRIFESKLGTEHTETARCRADLGRALLLATDRDGARQALQEAFKVLNGRLSDAHPLRERVRGWLSEVDPAG